MIRSHPTLFLAGLLLLILDNSVAQTTAPALDWGFAYDTSYGYVQPISICVAPDNNILVTGFYKGTPNMKLGSETQLLPLPHFGKNWFLAKYTPEHQLMWVRHFTDQSANEHSPYGLISDSKGNIFLYGEIQGFVIFDSINSQHDLFTNNDFNSFITKFDSDGNVVWAHIFEEESAAGNFGIYDLELDANDNLYFTGQFRNSVYLNPLSNTPITSTQRNSLVIASFDNHGHYRWHKFITGADEGSLNTLLSNQDFENLELTQKGEIVVAGMFSKEVDVDPGEAKIVYKVVGERDFFLFYLDSIGNFKNVVHFPSEYRKFLDCYEIKIDPFDNLYVYGGFSDGVDLDPGPGKQIQELSNYFSSFLLKLDPKGNYLWDINFDINAYPTKFYGVKHGTEITTDSYGNLIFANTFSHNIDILPGPKDSILQNEEFTNNDAFIVKYSGSGNLMWSAQLKCKASVFTRDIFSDINGNIYLPGIYKNQLDLDPTEQNYYLKKLYYSQGFFAKYQVQLPKVNLGTDTVLCYQGGLELNTHLHGYRYKWSNGDTSRKTTVHASGIYWVDVFSEAGKVSDTIQVNFKSRPYLNLGNDTGFCDTFSLAIQPEIYTADSIISYAWSTGQTAKEIKVTQTGIYHLTIRNKQNCTNRDTLYIRRLPPPKITLPADTFLPCSNQSLILEIKEDNISQTVYNWSNGETGPIASITDSGWVYITANIPNCTTLDSLYIGYNCIPPLYIPSAFTPNSDGINDTFKPIGTQVKSYTLKIYNRWGECMLDGHPNQPWDGYYKGKQALQGNYIYVLEISQYNGETVILKGDFVLIGK